MREPWEVEIARIEGAKHIPLDELECHVKELNPQDEIVVYCKKGIRGIKALNILKGRGFEKVKNLSGGIDAWCDSVDPALPRY